MFDAVDRVNGKYVFSRDLGLQNMVTAIDPKTGKKTINPTLEPKPQDRVHLPRCQWREQFAGTSYDPSSRILYVPLSETCTDYSWAPRDAAQTAAGGNDIRYRRRRPDSDGKIGRMEAINS